MTDEIPPLIVTAALDQSSFWIFNERRIKHFPPERNFLAAHLTLFHHLPGEDIATVTGHVKEAIDKVTTFDIVFSSVRFLGRGVAVNVESNELHALRKHLAESFDQWLRPQDRQKFQPHITIQNKVEPEAAKALFGEMQKRFEPFRGQVTGVELWHYLGGPWRIADRFALRPPVDFTSTNS